jgi:ketosteroid isomerase-like protein
MRTKQLVVAALLSAVVAGVTLFPAASGNAETVAAPAACSEPESITPALQQEILKAREAVWRAWFNYDRKELEIVIPEDTVAINSGDGPWEDRAAVIEGSRKFAQGGGKLVRLEFPRTEIRLYGDVAVLYSNWLTETQNPDGKREVSSGRGTEIFVRRDGRWVNPGWHLDSGK